MKKLLSLIIPTYNCAEYIDETLALILSELPGNCELILVDDGSTDSTPDILKKYAGRAAGRVGISIREHAGVSVTRNAGLDMADSEWIAFMDCDDCLMKGFFKESLKLLNDFTDLYIFSFERVELLPGFEKQGARITGLRMKRERTYA